MEDVEGDRDPSESILVFFWIICLLISSLQADHLETMMRDQLKVQELMDTHLNQRDEELCQL